MPESKDLPSSLVTVCGAEVILVQVTVVPTLMVIVAGLKAKLPLLSVVMVTAIALPDVVGVVALVVGVLPVAVVGVVPVPEPLSPPHAASRTSAARANMMSQARWRYLDVGEVLRV